MSKFKERQQVRILQSNTNPQLAGFVGSIERILPLSETKFVYHVRIGQTVIAEWFYDYQLKNFK